MRIDLHVHSRERSACGKSGEEEMIQAAISCGLDGLRPLCNSDAHEARHVGLHYNQLEHTPRGERELLNMLRAGDYVCHGLKLAAVVNREIEGRNQPYWPRVVLSIVGGGR